MDENFGIRLASARSYAAGFVRSLSDNQDGFRFTPVSDSSPFSRVFGVFCSHLLGISDQTMPNQGEIAQAIRDDLLIFKRSREKQATNILLDKHYLQLFSFSLSALSVLSRDAVEALDHEQLLGSSNDLYDAVKVALASPGEPQFGNINMAHGALLLWLLQSGRQQDCGYIDLWVQSHLNKMNDFGFWGAKSVPTYSQFQNGYHQYEILDYLGVQTDLGGRARVMVAAMMDASGGFSPYVGGGGCYDYDAVYMLTRASGCDESFPSDPLKLIANYLLDRQNKDGGFGESLHIRPLNLENVTRQVKHVLSGMPDRQARLKHFLTMLRSKHNRYVTHFSAYQREWGESNLWDTWFRLMALARLEAAIHGDTALDNWGFINFPGIGFHEGLRRN